MSFCLIPGPKAHTHIRKASYSFRQHLAPLPIISQSMQIDAWLTPQGNRFTYSSNVNVSVGSEEQHPLSTCHKITSLWGEVGLGRLICFHFEMKWFVWLWETKSGNIHIKASEVKKQIKIIYVHSKQDFPVKNKRPRHTQICACGLPHHS